MGVNKKMSFGVTKERKDRSKDARLKDIVKASYHCGPPMRTRRIDVSSS